MSTTFTPISSASSTAAAAKVFLALTLFSGPATVSAIPAALEQQIRPTPKTTTLLPLAESDGPFKSSNVTRSTWIGANDNVVLYDEPDRLTTPREKLIGEVRRWNLLKANWDGEGAAVPVARSLKEAVSFIRLLVEVDTLPEPMLHASGHAGLFWKDDNLYADIKFLGDGRVAYYIERQGDKHKGVLNFDSKKMPAVFPTLLRA